MKLLHLADLHLGKSVHGRDLIEDQAYALKQVVALARAEKPDALILAGDVFDRAVPSTDALKLFNEFIVSLKDQDPKLCVAVIPGNHDSAQRLAFLSGVLEGGGVHLRADPEDCATPVTLTRAGADGTGERLRLWLLPFLTPGCLALRRGDDALSQALAREPAGGAAAAPETSPASDEASLGELFASAASLADPAPKAPAGAAEPGALEALGAPRLLRSQDELFREALARIAIARAELDTLDRRDAALAGAADGGALAIGRSFDVLVCHAFAAGAQGSDSERVFLGAAELVDAALFDSFDYAALGHLHRPQAAGLKGRYPGSLLQYSFADAPGERGCLVVEMGGPNAGGENAGSTNAGDTTTSFVTLEPLRRMSRIEGSLDRLLSDARFSAMEGDYVEALLQDGEGVLNPMDALRSRFPWILSLRLEGAEGDGGAPYAPTEPGLARNLLDDFRDFYRELKGESPDEAVEALFLALAEEAGRETD
jgi:DNA repair protein SbcD/Mre11